VKPRPPLSSRAGTRHKAGKPSGITIQTEGGHLVVEEVRTKQKLLVPISLQNFAGATPRAMPLQGRAAHTSETFRACYYDKVDELLEPVKAAATTGGATVPVAELERGHISLFCIWRSCTRESNS
jgi:hypothetical protein